jgi:hypothetical protein
MATLNNVITNANGCVGIGTTSPTGTYGKLTVAGGIRTLDDNNSKLELGRYSAGASNSYIKLGTNSNALHFTNAADNADIFTILNGGNVGIGTTSPTRKLHIDGGATTTVGIYIDANGISGTDIEQSSDAFRFQIRDNIPALFYTNNTERIRIASDGNVGIGTSSPVSKLHLDDATAPYITITRTGVPTWQLRNNFPVNQYGFSFNNTTAGTTPLFIGAGGNIGIGTSGPTNRLDVVGGSGTTFNMSNDGDSQRGGKLTFISSSATGRQFYVGTTSAIYNLVFGIDSVEKARIDTAGNLGINTTSPNAKLHVSASASTTAGIFQGVVGIGLTPTSAVPRLQIYGTSTSNAESRLAIYTSNTGTAYNNGLQLAVASDSVTSLINCSNTALYFGTNSTERMRITSTGDVGIGTSNPAALLNAYRNSNTTAPIGYFQEVYGSPAKTNVVLVERLNNLSNTNVSASSAGVRIRDHSNNYALSVEDHSGNSYMVIKGGGNVGIGTSNPKNKLHVSGLMTQDGAIVYSKVNSITTNNPIRITIPFTKINTGADFIVKVKAIAMANNSSGVNYLDYVGYSGYTFNFNTNLTTIEKYGNVVVNSYVSASSGTAGNLYIELNGDDGYLQDSNWTIQTDILGNSMYSTFDSGSITTIATSISEDSLETSFNKYFGGNIGIGTTSFVYSNAARGDVEVYGSTDALISLRNATANSYLQKTGNDFYFNNGGAGFISITTNTSERMRITSDGNVGIGTSSPGEKLGILNGNIQLLATSGDPYIRLTDNGVRNWYLKVVDTSDYFEVGGTNATSLVVKGDGNVGIGTTSPTATLDVSKMEYPSLGGILASFTAGTTTPTTEKFVYLKQTYTGAAYDSPMLVFRANANSVNSGSFGTVRTTSNGSIAFSNVNATSGTVTAVSEKMRIDANGNVGIGTTVIRSKLEIAGNTSSPPIASVQWTPTARSGSFGIDGTGVYIRNSSNGDYFDLKNASGVARFRVIYDNATHLTTNFVSIGNLSQTGSKLSVFGNTSIGSSYGSVAAPSNGLIVQGSVGIGTTAPSGSLTIQTNGTQLRLQTASGPSAYYSTINSLYDSTHPFSIAVAGNSLTTAEYFGIYADSGGSNPRIALLNGNVGIGTTTPFGTAANRTVLSVNGTTDVSLNIGSGGSQRAYLYGVSTYAELGTIGSLPLTFAPNNTEKMRLNVDGNVGIGTTSPAYKLEVNGSLYATRLSGSAMFTTSGKGRFYGTASYALAAPAGSSLTGQTDSATPFETSLGYQAGNVNTGTGNTAIGYQALLNNTTGTGSIAIGYQALYTNTRGKRNIAIGYEALRTTQGSTDVYGDPIGDENVAIGYQAARAAFNINRVVAIGHRALAKNLAGGNVAIGWLAMESNVGTANSNSGVLNTAVGTMALSSNTSGNANSAFGYLALNSNTTGNENTAVGHRSMVYNTTGKNNCSFGSYALYYNQIANNNSAFGNFALYNNTAKNNSAFGYKALRFNTTGVNNCAFGSGSLYNNTSGTKNTTVGGNAGSTITTGTNLSVFGYNAQASTATATNEVTLGNSSVATLRCQVTTITALSDFRDKTDINNVEVGLSFVEKLRPVTFKWDKREWYTDGNRDGSKKDTITQIGFIAQELKALQESENATYLNLVYESNPDKLEATPGNLMIPLIKAVQELNAIVKQQRIEFDDKIAKQQLEIDYLKSKLNN